MDNPYNNFGIKLFDKNKMKRYLPHPVYKKWRQSVLREESMDRESADAIAHAMKMWAMEQGATHYSHWFHPMTGASAEKHDAFIEPDTDGNPITRFSGKNLIKGETDGSSFPNGGLRQTFEARGYTYWDMTSPAFIRGHVLFIPSIFISFHGDSLDEKAPLLKAMEILSYEATRVVNALGDKTVTSVRTSVGLEQEYFLIDRETYLKRDDLLYTGRTIIGSKPPKGQELIGHYYGSIPSDIIHFMEDVNEELWKLGIYSKVEHNEVAPSQYEVAVVFADANVAVDQNMLVMETLQRVALKHNRVALLHEKPFSYINGSGKHNNFSLLTNTNQNLFDPGDRPQENIRFLTFAAALIKAVDKHAELLRFAASSVGNDFRLGSDEAPPAIVSMYIGTVLENIFSGLLDENVSNIYKEIQYFSPLSSLSAAPKDYSDRNRTSPFAFTGNKFEFRMPGSSICPAFVNTTLCSILSESLSEIANELENYKYVQEAREHALEICKKIYMNHKRIIFNGDGYHESWIKEAELRGLKHNRNSIEASKALLSSSTLQVFNHGNVLNQRELTARFEVAQSRFIDTVETEVNVLIYMVKKYIIPSTMKEIRQTIRTIDSLTYPNGYLESHRNFLISSLDNLDKMVTECEAISSNNHLNVNIAEKSEVTQNKLRPLCLKIRVICDNLEVQLPHDVYTLPTYKDLLFK